MGNIDFKVHENISSNENKRREFLKNLTLAVAGTLMLGTFGCKTEKYERKEGALMVDQSPDLLNNIAYFGNNIESIVNKTSAPNPLCEKINSIHFEDQHQLKEFLLNEPLTADEFKSVMKKYSTSEIHEQILITLLNKGIVSIPGYGGIDRYAPFEEMTVESTTVYIINHPNFSKSGSFLESPYPNVPGFVVLNLDAVGNLYVRSRSILEELNLSHLVIDFPRHLVSILEQELYHATTPNDTERESEKVSINIAGQFYMASRVYDASLAANPSHAGRFNERLDNSNNPGYRDMYEKYAAIFKSFAPKFVPNPNGDLISDLKRAISENPGILTYMCKQALSQ